MKRVGACAMQVMASIQPPLPSINAKIIFFFKKKVSSKLLIWTFSKGWSSFSIWNDIFSQHPANSVTVSEKLKIKPKHFTWTHFFKFSSLPENVNWFLLLLKSSSTPALSHAAAKRCKHHSRHCGWLKPWSLATFQGRYSTWGKSCDRGTNGRADLGVMQEKKKTTGWQEGGGESTLASRKQQWSARPEPWGGGQTCLVQVLGCRTGPLHDGAKAPGHAHGKAVGGCAFLTLRGQAVLHSAGGYSARLWNLTMALSYQKLALQVPQFLKETPPLARS